MKWGCLLSYISVIFSVQFSNFLAWFIFWQLNYYYQKIHTLYQFNNFTGLTSNYGFGSQPFVGDHLIPYATVTTPLSRHRVIHIHLYLIRISVNNNISGIESWDIIATFFCIHLYYKYILGEHLKVAGVFFVCKDRWCLFTGRVMSVVHYAWC